MKTDTPRTDEEIFEHPSGYEVVISELAYQLERELTAARAELTEWHDAAESVKAEYPDEVHCTCVPILRKQIKTLTEQRDAVTLRLGNTQERMFNAERQRDKLAEALRKIKNEGGRFNDPYDELDFIDGITYEALQSLTNPNNNQ